MCHLDRIVLQQTWLCLASDGPSEACLKQCGSVDDYCYRQQPGSSKTPGSQGADSGINGGVGDGHGEGGGAGRRRERRYSRQVRKFKRSKYGDYNASFLARRWAGRVVEGVRRETSRNDVGGKIRWRPRCVVHD